MKLINFFFSLFNIDLQNCDSQFLIYDELSSGEDYWGDSSFEEMEKFCKKNKLNDYLKRIEKLKEKRDERQC